MDISVARHAVRAADRALSIAAKARSRFRNRVGRMAASPVASVISGPVKRATSVARLIGAWLIAPAQTYPQPPIPEDRNCRGIGWSGRSRERPFSPPVQQRLAHTTVHENINPGAYK